MTDTNHATARDGRTRMIRTARAIAGVASVATCAGVWGFGSISHPTGALVSSALSLLLVGLAILYGLLWITERVRRGPDHATVLTHLGAFPSERIPLRERPVPLAYLAIVVVSLGLFGMSGISAAIVGSTLALLVSVLLSADLASGLYSLRGDHEAALRAARILTLITPTGQLQLAQVLLQLGRLDEADTALRRAPRTRTTSPLLVRLLARRHAARGRDQDALAMAESGVAAHPEDPQVYGPLIVLLLEQGEVERAQQLLELRRSEIRWSPVMALLYRPLEPVFMALEAWALHASGDTLAAEAAIQRALDETPSRNRAVVAQVLATRARYSTETADADRRSAIETDPAVIHTQVWVSEG